jgi:hypothetical protein
MERGGRCPPCMPRAESSAGWHCAMGAGARQCNAQQPAAAEQQLAAASSRWKKVEKGGNGGMHACSRSREQWRLLEQPRTVGALRGAPMPSISVQTVQMHQPPTGFLQGVASRRRSLYAPKVSAAAAVVQHHSPCAPWSPCPRPPAVGYVATRIPIHSLAPRVRPLTPGPPGAAGARSSSACHQHHGRRQERCRGPAFGSPWGCGRPV